MSEREVWLRSIYTTDNIHYLHADMMLGIDENALNPNPSIISESAWTKELENRKIRNMIDREFKQRSVKNG